MFGFPLWVIVVALVNLLTVVWWATGFLDELQVTDRPNRFGTVLVRGLCVLVASVCGVLFVSAVSLATAIYRRRVVRELAASRAVRATAARSEARA